MVGWRSEIKGEGVTFARPELAIAFQGGCHSSYARLIFKNEGYCLKVIKKSNFLSESAILGSTPKDEISLSRKLLVLPSKRFLISDVILGSVIINRPENKNFLVATSDSIEFRHESFGSKGPGANSRT